MATLLVVIYRAKFETEPRRRRKLSVVRGVHVDDEEQSKSGDHVLGPELYWNRSAFGLESATVPTNSRNWVRWINYAFKNKRRRKYMYTIFAALIYFIWRERNGRIFAGVERSVAMVMGGFKREIAVKLASSFPHFRNWQDRDLVAKILAEL
ncbi:hypothetical protein RIF29_13896 [Crotalaria pallida]|uniref:Uncharacterized protein n=1 Tax=Crotalaria pallida TaxID=3830 RepID=A0AAN9FCT3_CROPI